MSRSKKVPSPLAMVLTAYLAYSIGWSYIALARIYSLNADVHDLGINLQWSWDAVHTGLSVLLSVATQKSALLIYAPLLMLGQHAAQAFVIFQSAWLGAGSLPLYGIARRALKSNWAASFISLAYLIYFPMAGVNWFDVHMQALFPTFFLTAWYIWLRGGRWRWAGATLMALSGTLRFGYEIYPLWVSLTLLVEGLVTRKSLKDYNGPAALTLLMTIALTVTALRTFSFGVIQANTPTAHELRPSGISLSNILEKYMRLDLNLTSLKRALDSTVLVPQLLRTPNEVTAVALVSQLELDIITVILALSPLLFLPLASWRWAPLLAPFFILVFLSTFWGYHYPAMFKLQYPSTFLAAAWLGTVEAIALIGSKMGRRAVLSLSLAVLAVNGVYAMAFEPYGPLNGRSGIDYGLSGVLRAAHSDGYAQLMEVISMVPRNMTAVAIQNNELELFPRPGGDAMLGCYPNLSYIDYIVADAMEPSYLIFSNTDVCDDNMLEVLNQALTSGRFGLEAQVGYAYLLVRNYTGPLRDFVPLSELITADDLVSMYGSRLGNRYFVIANYTGPLSPLFMEEYAIVLGPGNYTVTYEIMRFSGNYTLALVGYSYCDISPESYMYVSLFNETVGPKALPLDSWTNVTVGFNLSCFGYTTLTAESTNVNGALLVKGIYIKQLSP